MVQKHKCSNVFFQGQALLSGLLQAPFTLDRLCYAALHECAGSFCWHAEHVLGCGVISVGVVQKQSAVTSFSKARLCCQGFCRLHGRCIGSTTLRFMIVLAHSAGMQSISCDLGNFSRKGTKTQLLHHLLPGPGFAVRSSAGSIQIG